MVYIKVIDGNKYWAEIDLNEKEEKIIYCFRNIKPTKVLSEQEVRWEYIYLVNLISVI